MPDLREVFEMTTKQMGEPDQDSWHEQEKRQRNTKRNKKFGAIAVAAALVVAGVMIGISTLKSDDVQPAGSESKPPPVSTATTKFIPYSGTVEPGTYVVSALDPGFDASYAISVSVPGGYQAFQGWGITKNEGREWMSASVVSRVYANPCHWRGTATDPPTGRNFHALVAALASQQGLHVSTPTGVTLAGFSGKRMERTVPAGTSLADCDDGQFRFWLDSGGGERYTPFTSEHQELWVVDVDGVPLVIEAAWPLGAPAQVQAELTQMVETINIDPQ